LGENAVIASLSLGTNRVFELKHRYKSSLQTLKTTLSHGSVLIMKGSIQQYWQHRIAKVKNLDEARINFTFRKILRKKVEG